MLRSRLRCRDGIPPAAFSDLRQEIIHGIVNPDGVSSRTFLDADLDDIVVFPVRNPVQRRLSAHGLPRHVGDVRDIAETGESPRVDFEIPDGFDVRDSPSCARNIPVRSAEKFPRDVHVLRGVHTRDCWSDAGLQETVLLSISTRISVPAAGDPHGSDTVIWANRFLRCLSANS
jgi:hypothetical protein